MKDKVQGEVGHGQVFFFADVLNTEKRFQANDFVLDAIKSYELFQLCLGFGQQSMIIPGMNIILSGIANGRPNSLRLFVKEIY